MEDGGGARDDFDGKIFAAGRANDPFSWVGDAGHPRVGDEGDGLARADAVEDFCFAGGLIKFLVAEKRFFEAKMLEEESGVAGIFGGDEIGGGEGLAGAGRDIGEISDGGADDEEATEIH